MNCKAIFLVLILLSLSQGARSQILNRSLVDAYVNTFNKYDDELYVQHVSNKEAKDFLADNIPFFECPDKKIEEIYYFRWWTYRKHLKLTPDGFIVTEFLPDVPWAGKYNGICCPAWFHFREGRWLHDSSFLKDYANYWLRGGGSLRTYSFPISDALLQYSLVTGNEGLLHEYYTDLKTNYLEWKKEKFNSDMGLFWQVDGNDGMEVSIGGTGYRATINSYMYAEAKVLHELSLLKQDTAADFFQKEMTGLKKNLFLKLWDANDHFFKVLPNTEHASLCSARELHGYTPWAFDIPDTGYAIAWKYLMDSNHFFAPFGPTTAEQCHPGFKIAYEGHECQWNGPSWPYSTAMTLISLANLLNNQDQKYISKRDYYILLSIYANSQYKQNEEGDLIPWIDENLNPFTGDWISRTLLKQRNQKPDERGKHYNHSAYCDLIISGLVGVRPQANNEFILNPLIPEGVWDYFCLENVLYHGDMITVVYDKTGKKYNVKPGLTVLVNGKEVAHSEGLCRLKISLD